MNIYQKILKMKVLLLFFNFAGFFSSLCFGGEGVVYLLFLFVFVCFFVQMKIVGLMLKPVSSQWPRFQ